MGGIIKSNDNVSYFVIIYACDINKRVIKIIAGKYLNLLSNLVISEQRKAASLQ